jgi:putative membrane protein
MALNLLLVWLINALALLALPYVVPSVQVDSFTTALIAALLLGLVNTLIRLLVVLLTLPVTVVTLGLFVFVINGLLFWFVASFVKGFSVAGFWSAVLGAIVSWAASTLVFGERRVVVVRHDEYRRQLAELGELRVVDLLRPEPGDRRKQARICLAGAGTLRCNH